MIEDEREGIQFCLFLLLLPPSSLNHLDISHWQRHHTKRCRQMPAKDVRARLILHGSKNQIEGRVLTETRLDDRLLDKRVFIVVFIFTFVSAMLGVQRYLPFLLSHQTSYVDIAAASQLFYFVGFIIDPLLFFIVLYRYCGGELLNRMARVLISIALASLLGLWIGNLALAGAVTVFSSAEEAAANFFFLSPISSLPIQVVFKLLEAFAVLAFSDLVPKWKSTLPVNEPQGKTPGGIVFLAAVYVVFALLNMLVLPVSALWGSADSIVSIVPIAVGLGILTVGQFVLGIGLYSGKKWAWVLAVVSTGSTLLIDVSILGVFLALESHGIAAAPWLLVGLFFGSLISLVIVVYLLKATVRKFFGLVNLIEHTN